MTYTYKCKQCNTEKDYELSISDTKPTTCENCKGELVRIFKPISMNLNFKGSYNSTRS